MIIKDQVTCILLLLHYPDIIESGTTSGPTPDPTFISNGTLSTPTTLAFNASATTPGFTSSTNATTKATSLAFNESATTPGFTSSTNATTKATTLDVNASATTSGFSSSINATTKATTLAVNASATTPGFTSFTNATTKATTLAVNSSATTHGFTSSTYATTKATTLAVNASATTSGFTRSTYATTKATTLAVNATAATPGFTIATNATMKATTLAVNASTTTPGITSFTYATTKATTLAVNATATTPGFTSSTNATTKATTLVVNASATTLQFTSSTSNNATKNEGCSVNYTAISWAETFSSPNFPKNYSNGMYCEFRFNALSAKKRAVSNYGVELRFHFFDLEAEKYCLHDYIQIHDGSTTDDLLIGRYCGSEIPPTALGSKSTLLVIFSSDQSRSYQGFTSEYMEIDICYPNCKAYYWNQITASSSKQTIQNSAYPSTYLPNTDEYFLINYSATLILQPIDVDIERSKDCIFDRIVIYNERRKSWVEILVKNLVIFVADGCQARAMLGCEETYSFCGPCPSFGILSTHCGTFQKRWEPNGPEYLVHFHTDSSIQNKGFKMEIFLGTASTGPPTTTTTTAGPPVEAEMFVMDEILTTYSVENFPNRDLSTPIGTTIDVYIVRINDLDEAQQKLTTTVLIEARWQDDFLKWEITKQGGVVKLLVPQNDTWKPDLAVLNGFDSIVQFGDKFMYVLVESNGSCQWRPNQILSTTCNVDMTNYPFDTHSCDLKFSTWSSKSDQVTTTIGAKGLETREFYVKSTQWTLLSISQQAENIGSQNVVTFTLTLKRNPAFIIYHVAIPVVMLALINVFTFVLPHTTGQRTSYSIIVFLSFLVYVILTYQKLPENSDKISLFALYVLILTMISCISVIITVLELRLLQLDKTSKRISKGAEKFIRFTTKIKCKIICLGKDKDNVPQSLDTYISCKGYENEVRKDSWRRLVYALDFYFFFLFFTMTLSLTCVFLIYIAVQ